MHYPKARWAAGALAVAITLAGLASAQSTTNPSTTQPTTEPTSLHRVLVISNLDKSRDQIAPALGANEYTQGPAQIQNLPGGENAPFQQILLRMPGTVADSFGQEHVRGEHANLTYRINGVILPEPLNGFGQELDTHIIDSVTLIDGALPAQFGFRTTGIVDVTAKSGANLQGGEISFYGGGDDTIEPSISVGGTGGDWDYFVTGSFKHDNLGVENPTGNAEAIHDATNQTRAFVYLTDHLDDTSRLSFILNSSYGTFQIPDTAGLTPSFTVPGASPNPNSANINENQIEQQYYDVVSYQKTAGDFSMLLSGYISYGNTHFFPDSTNDLLFQGTAAEVEEDFTTEGLQFDASDRIDLDHTLRFGAIAENTQEYQNTNTLVFPADPASVNADGTGDAPAQLPGSSPKDIVDDTSNRGLSAGVYVQDEWKLSPHLTLNYGARFDIFDSNFDNQSQLSPRINLVWKMDDDTTFHAGYARYFVPPTVQYIPPSTIQKYVFTTNAPTTLTDDPPKAEQSNYFDVGISHQITKAWFINADAFYKRAHNLIDNGQFGQALILSDFNYEHGYDYGPEISTTYKENNLSAFANFAYTRTGGENIDSQQFLIASDELAFIQNHYIRLDHESDFEISSGVSYDLSHNDTVYTDMIFASGLRSGFANTEKVPSYETVNCGYEHTIPLSNPNTSLKLRADVVNVFDQVYEIRSGSGIGVAAAQYGQRRTFYFGVAYDF